MSDNIKVVVKVRPLISREIEEKLPYQWRIRNNTLQQIDANEREVGSCFTFDKVYNETTKTKEVFNDVAKPIVEAAIAGFNGTIFAYGQTSSGKTYTMTGTPESPGIIPLAVQHLFEKIKALPDRDFLVRVSYIEIYNETLTDLLALEKKNIKIHDTLHGVKVDVTEKVTSSPDEVLEAMKMGEVNRQTGATTMNEESSRSHSIFQIIIESREHIEGEDDSGCVNVSQLNLVDLAGSERAGQTGATGIRFKEGTHINKSLSALGLVIKQLSEEPNKYINYRDSKLTRILQNSLGGNAKTSIICAITPASAEETVSTLQFANRAKAIKNKPEVNAVATNATMIQSLTKQLSRLQSELESKKHIEKDNEELQKRIVNLRNVILNRFEHSTTDLGVRRNAQQRRFTIHATLLEEPKVEPTVTRFCTPGLKYNPLITPGAMDFLPIPSLSNLAPVPEEPSTRMITPPPPDKGIPDPEIINLDSDHDSSTDQPTCSPYHKCYGSSKTPPCVLRKNAKEAEMKLKDIEELTEREKVYPPDLVELIEKLEQNTAEISTLKEEINTLTEQGNEKDTQLKELSDKVKKTEEELENITALKSNLEKQCEENTKTITDLEVSYDTLKKKYKTREEELLSLLEEKTSNIEKSMNKRPEKDSLNFMDMSKDISLVNSDGEISIVHPSNEETLLIADLQVQVKAKDDVVAHLETLLATQKERIESLENCSHELKAVVQTCQSKLSRAEAENEYLKSTIDSLNSMLETQKKHIETTNKDVESYNDLIAELHKQVALKESIVTGKLNDMELEELIDSENKVIANNENLKNIILSFKIAIQARNNEINKIKCALTQNSDYSAMNKELQAQLDVKEQQLNSLLEEIKTLKEQLIENTDIIKQLMQTEHVLNSKLSDLENQNESLNKLNQERTTQIKVLEKEIEDQKQDLTHQNNQLLNKVENMYARISDLERDNDEKTKVISTVKEDCLLRSTSTSNRLLEILSVISPCTNEVTQVSSDDLDDALAVLNDRLNILMTSALDIVEERKQMINSQEALKLEIFNSERNIIELQTKVDDLNKEKTALTSRVESVMEQVTSLSEDLEKVSNELALKNQEVFGLEENLKSLQLQIKELTHRENDHIALNEINNQNTERLTQDINDLRNMLADKEFELAELHLRLTEINDERNKLLVENEKRVSQLTTTLEDIALDLMTTNKEVQELQINLSQCKCFGSPEGERERLELMNTIEESSETIRKLSVELQQAQNTAKLKEEEVKALEKELKGAQGLFEKCTQEKIQLLSENNKLSQDLQHLTNELHAVENEVKLKADVIIELEAKLKVANGAKDALQLEVQELNKASMEFLRVSESMSLQISQLTEARDKLYTELDIKKLEIEEMLDKIKSANEENYNNTNLKSKVEELQEVNIDLHKRSESSLQQVMQLTEQIAAIHKEISDKDNLVVDLESKLSEANQRISDLLAIKSTLDEVRDERNDLIDQNDRLKQQNALLMDEFNRIRNESNVKEVSDLGLNNANEETTVQDSPICLNSEKYQGDNHSPEIAPLLSEIETKEKIIGSLFNDVDNLKASLEKQQEESENLQEKLQAAVASKIELLEKILEITQDWQVLNYQNIGEVEITRALDNIRNLIILLAEKKNFESATVKPAFKTESVKELKQENQELMQKLLEMQFENQELSHKLQKATNFNKEAISTTELMTHLKSELTDKSDELSHMENKVKKLKSQLNNYEDVMKQQMTDLQSENENVKDLQKSWQQSSVQFNSPPSLLSICCKRIIKEFYENCNQSSTKLEYNELRRTKSLTNISDCITSAPDSTSTVELRPIESLISICECSELSARLALMKEENEELRSTIKDLECSNSQLLEEREEVQKEIQLLIDPAIELQKKLMNHKSNLSTLTFTTYAENKLLNSQLKVLKHHHTRYIRVCQRDLPSFKSQLHELLSILKDNSSYIDKNNSSVKRFSLPDVLDENNSISTFKNDSTFDGDFLMLDSNVTLTTSTDNTLLGQDQSCLDVTQINFDSEVACQTNDLSKAIDPYSLDPQIDILTHENQKMIENLEMLRLENASLKEEINKLLSVKGNRVDAQSSPIKFNGTLDESFHKERVDSICESCKLLENEQTIRENLQKQLQDLVLELDKVKSQKESIEKQYNDLVLEMPHTDSLVKKLCDVEKEYKDKVQKVTELTKDLTTKNKLIKELTEENDLLSNQVMESISEADDLRKEFDSLKDRYNKLEEKCVNLEKNLKETEFNATDILCKQCVEKDEIITSLKYKPSKESYSLLNRSLSDSDSSSRLNKLSTLQSELDASKEDCKKITEEVATIKNHLEQRNLSLTQAMDVDENTNDAKKDRIEERSTDLYILDRTDCLNFYIEKTGVDKENISCDMKIIDVMQLLYNNVITKHGNEVQNLYNNMKDFEDERKQLHSQILKITTDNSQLTHILEEKESYLKNISSAIDQIKSNINSIQKEVSEETLKDNQSKVVTLFKEKFLNVLDSKFSLSSKALLELLIDKIVNKHQIDLDNIMEKYTKLQEHMDNVKVELSTVNENLIHMKEQLSTKEQEYNALKAQKERISEISHAVTLDIVQRDRELSELINSGFEKLVNMKIIDANDVVPNLSQREKINLLLDQLCHLEEVNKLKTQLKDVQCSLESLKSEVTEKDKNLESQKSLCADLGKLIQTTIEKKEVQVKKLMAEINCLKETINKKDELITILDGKLSAKFDESLSMSIAEGINDFRQKIQSLEEENNDLKSVNEIITKEKEVISLELEKSADMIKKNKLDMDKMTADILILRESVAENVALVNSLKSESQSLVEKNIVLKTQFEEKCKECTRLETNIKIHEKTAAIQSKSIMRLQKLKEQDDEVITEKNKQLEEFTQKCEQLTKAIETITNSYQKAQARVSELEAELEEALKRRSSLDAKADNARRRRQSLHDSRRMFPDDVTDPNKIEAHFESRAKPDDLFMDVDDPDSNHSTPHRPSSRGRDSFPLRHESDEEPARPSSVQATRRRRQSIHDLHRDTRHQLDTDHTPLRLIDEINNADAEISGNVGEVALSKELREVKEELAELKERYRELDEECETCAQYLRERDEQCRKLREAKAALEKQVNELNQKLQLNKSEVKVTVTNASVNTDEDWANLHSVVVDRMSFDAEVEKNKKLTRTIEELRCKKQELKNLHCKDAKELEAMRNELKSCKEELADLKERYRELDEECETCAQYLRERDEQCRKLKEAKAALEARVQELSSASPASWARRKRHTAHDLNRDPAYLHVLTVDAATNTTDDLCRPLEREDSSLKATENLKATTSEMKRLKTALEKALRDKAALESAMAARPTQPAATVTPALYVATGSAIVQNQQLTDVMRENQKLKKLNANLIKMCKKRNKTALEDNRENEDPDAQDT